MRVKDNSSRCFLCIFAGGDL